MLDTIKLSVENAGYTFGDEIMIALELLQLSFVNGKYDYSKFEGETGKIRSSAEQVDYLAELALIQLSRLKMEWMKMIGMDGKCLPIKWR
jgi:enolase